VHQAIFACESCRQGFIERCERHTMLPSQGDKVVVSDLIRTRDPIGADDSVVATQVIRDKPMARVRQ
jgi:hypothetical protein